MTNSKYFFMQNDKVKIRSFCHNLNNSIKVFGTNGKGIGINDKGNWYQFNGRGYWYQFNGKGNSYQWQR